MFCVQQIFRNVLTFIVRGRNVYLGVFEVIKHISGERSKKSWKGFFVVVFVIFVGGGGGGFGLDVGHLKNNKQSVVLFVCLLVFLVWTWTIISVRISSETKRHFKWNNIDNFILTKFSWILHELCWNALPPGHFSSSGLFFFFGLI